MINKSIKKIWLFCLCLASLNLVGCFHVPDEDWLPSRNKVKTEDMKKENAEVEQAINSLVDWFNMISSEWDEMKNNEEIVWEENGIENAENNKIKGETNEKTDKNYEIGEDNANIEESVNNTWNDLVD